MKNSKLIQVKNFCTSRLRMAYLVLLAVTLIQCSTAASKRQNQEFLAKHGKAEFELFSEKKITYENGTRSEIKVAIRDLTADNTGCDKVDLRIDRTSKKLIGSIFVPEKNDCHFEYDEEVFYELARAFLDLGVNSLTVDKLGNVAVKTQTSNNDTQLIRLSDQAGIEDFEHYMELQDGWYWKKG